MQKLINRPEDFVDEVLDGILRAHPTALKRGDDPRAIVRADAPVSGKVAIATGGGSRHLPVFSTDVLSGISSRHRAQSRCWRSPALRARRQAPRCRLFECRWPVLAPAAPLCAGLALSQTR